MYIDTISTCDISYVYYINTVRARSVLELVVRLNSVSFHKEFRKETGKHGQIIILGQFETLSQLKLSPSKGHLAKCLSFARTGVGSSTTLCVYYGTVVVSCSSTSITLSHLKTKP